MTTTDPNTNTDTGRRLEDLLDGLSVAMLATQDGGAISSRPLTIQHVEGGRLYFVVDAQAPWLSQATERPVAVISSDSKHWVSVTGRGRVETSREAIAAEAGPVAEGWFGGKAQEQGAVLIVEPDAVDTWTSPNKAAEAFAVVKGILTGTRPDAGDRDHIDLG